MSGPVFPGSIPPEDDYVMPDLTAPAPEDVRQLEVDREAWWSLPRGERIRRMAEVEDMLP